MHMRKLVGAGLLAITLTGLVMPPQAIAGGNENDVPFSAQVNLDNSEVMPDSGDTVVRAFILTRSANPNCLVSFGESNNAVAGAVAFCGVRRPTLYNGKAGVMVTVFFPGPVPDPLILTLTLHQDGAR